MTSTQSNSFLGEYSSQRAILKYTRATAGFGISHLLEHDYRAVYLEALRLLPTEVKQQGIRLLEIGCGAGMNLLHLTSVLSREGIPMELGLGSDFSPVLIDAACRESKIYLSDVLRSKVRFCIAKNETLLEDLAIGLGKAGAELTNSFHFILGVNTIRYCHRAQKEMNCARAVFDLLVPGGVCVVIDMNDRFPLFRSALGDRLRKSKEEYYLPSLEEYAAPFAKAGLEILRKDHFCWIPHSSGAFLCGMLGFVSPVLDKIARSRAMRALVLCRKPVTAPGR